MHKAKFIDALFICLMLAFGVFFVGLVHDARSNAQQLSIAQAQTSVLVREIGEAKEAQLILQQQVVEAQQSLEKMQTANQAQQQLLVTEEGAIIEPLSLALPDDPQPRIVLGTPDQVDTTNFLFVGHHQKLADSLVIAAVDSPKKRVTFISLPRDLLVNGRRINSYLSLFGIEELKTRVSEASGLAIHHYVVLDFDAFEDSIDLLGGVDIYVEKDIYDPLFPNKTLTGYEPYRIKAGSHHMTGLDALRYSRSRKSTSDFDRAGRQQQVLKALHERVVNLDLIKDFGILRDIFVSLGDGMETDVSLFQAMQFLDSFRSFAVRGGTVISPANVVYPITGEGGAYLLMPKGKNFTKMHQFIREKIIQE